MKDASYCDICLLSYDLALIMLITVVKQLGKLTPLCKEAEDAILVIILENKLLSYITTYLNIKQAGLSCSKLNLIYLD